jgi:MFS family permease
MDQVVRTHTTLPGDGGPGRSRSVLSPEYRSITISTLTAISLAAFDGLGVTAVQSTIAGDLGRVRLLPWVFTAFSLTLTIAALASGPLIDGLGLRRVYRFTLVTFLLASIGCAAAPTMETLIVARAVQGIGGGLVVAVALAAVGVTFPEDLRSRAFAANSTVWGVMSFAGPALAAALVRTPLGWRAVFVVNVPLTLFAAFIGWNRLPGRQPGAERVDFDLRGLALLSAFITLLLVGATEFNARAVGPVVLAIALGTWYWRHAGRTRSPLLARSQLTTRPFGAINVAVFMLFAGGLAVEGYVPLFVTGALGRSREIAAFSVTFMALGWTLASLVVSRLLDRVENTAVMVAGFLVAIPPLVVGLLTYSTSTPVALVAAMSLLQGAGVGSVTNAGLTLLQRSSPPGEMGRTSAAHQFLRNLGSTVGIAAVSGVLFGVVRHRIGDLEEIRPLLKGDESSPISAAARAAIASGYRTAHLVSLTLAIIGLAIVVRLHRWTRSSTRSASAAQTSTT